MTEPVALSELKTHLRLDPDATDEDAYLEGLIIAARRACEYRTNRTIIGGDKTLTLDRFPTAPAWPLVPIEAGDVSALWIDLPGGTVMSVESVSYFPADGGAAQTLSADSYILSPGNRARLAPVTSWPGTAACPGAVTISYTASPLDDDDWTVVGQAMKLLIGQWYDVRQPDGVTMEMPLTVSWLLDPLRRWALD